MAPINLPDGSEVSEVILPDGASASEVIAPDGSAVFGNAIPDSAIYRWKFNEGSGSTVNDSDPDGDGSTENGTINGASWISDSSYLGGTALDFNSTNSDNVSFFPVSALDASTTSFSCALTVNPDNETQSAILQSAYEGGVDRAVIGIGNSEIFAGTRINGSQFGKVESSIGDISTAGNIRVCYTFDSGNDSGQLFINGSDDTNSSSFDLRNISHTNDALTIGTENDGTDQPYDGIVDDVIVYTSVLSPSEAQSDYEVQPYS